MHMMCDDATDDHDVRSWRIYWDTFWISHDYLHKFWWWSSSCWIYLSMIFPFFSQKNIFPYFILQNASHTWTWGVYHSWGWLRDSHTIREEDLSSPPHLLHFDNSICYPYTLSLFIVLFHDYGYGWSHVIQYVPRVTDLTDMNHQIAVMWCYFSFLATIDKILFHPVTRVFIMRRACIMFQLIVEHEKHKGNKGLYG